MLTQRQIAAWLQAHRRRLKAGDDLAPLAEVARRAGLHRDVVFAAAAGERFSERTQWALSNAIEELDVELREVPSTRVMSVRLTGDGPRLRIGCSGVPVLRSVR